MIPVRLGFYVLYILSGAVIIVRVAQLGIRWQTASGLVLGAAFIAMGGYRIWLWSTRR